MKYPSPRRILEFLASHGTSAVQTEALALLAKELPDRWPEYARGSRESLLRRLAANQTKSAKARMEAMKELIAAMPAKQADEDLARREVDAILADVAREMGVSLDAKPAAQATWKVPKANPNPETLPVEDSKESPSVSFDGVSCPQDQQLEHPDPAEDKRKELLQRGHALAEKILAQRQRCEMALQNKQEGQRLDNLRAEWAKFEKEATAAGVDLQKIFGDKLASIRPFPISVDLARERRRLFVEYERDDVMRALLAGEAPRRTEEGHKDSGMWGGTIGI